MQTKQQIQQLLASAGVFPNKRHGQNFLIDLNLMRLLINRANIKKCDCVLEVGCGTGSLTEAIAEFAGACVVAEIDSTLAEIAKGQLAEKENVQIINADVLKNKNTINPAVIDAIALARENCDGRFMLVANLPYNVASAVMMNLITGGTVADSMFVTVQKEVADRMVAKSGSKSYGTLSIFLSAVGEVKIERVLKPVVFWPQPQIDSAMVSFIRSQEKASRIKDIKMLVRVVNLFMGHRRKMLKACIKHAPDKLVKIDDWMQIFEQCSIDPHVRPEQLSTEDYIAMANLCVDG